MKKLLSIVFCAAAVSAFGEETATAERTADLGTVGVTAITSSLSNTIVAVSYDDLAGGEGMVCSNLVKTTNLTEGDMLVEFRDDKYTGWVLMEDQGTKVKYWKEHLGAFVDSAGKQLMLVGSSADTVTNMVGTGIWLVRKKPTAKNQTDGEEVPVPFYIYGKPVSDPVSHISANTWTLVGNPLQNTTVTASTIQVTDAKTGDQIVTVGENGTLLYFAYVKNQGWSGLPDIGPGIGFWIKTQADTTITWPKEH